MDPMESNSTGDNDSGKADSLVYELLQWTYLNIKCTIVLIILILCVVCNPQKSRRAWQMGQTLPLDRHSHRLQNPGASGGQLSLEGSSWKKLAS